MNNEISYDNEKMSDILARAEQVKKKNVKKKKTTKNSAKKLQFEINEKDSTLTKAIKVRLNGSHYTQNDVDEFFIKLIEFDGDESRAKAKAYNCVYGLKKRNTMIDETFELWCEFLLLDIHLVERKK